MKQPSNYGVMRDGPSGHAACLRKRSRPVARAIRVALEG